MGIVDGAGGDGHPELNVESTRRNRELSAGVPLRTESFEDLDGNQQKSPPAPAQQLLEKKSQEQGSRGHSGVVGGGMDRGFQKVGGGGPILRPHRDQTAATAGLSGGGGHGIPGEKDGVQGMRAVAVAEAIVAAQQQSNGSVGNGVEGKGFKRDIRELEELLSKLNPMAEEFVPPVLANQYRSGVVGGHGGVLSNNIGFHHSLSNGNGSVNGDVNGGGRRKKNIFSQGKRMNNRTSMAQREEIIRRTVYVSDIDQQITEEHLAALFINCGQVVDCRICGDPHSVLRFAFIEFTDEEGARAALGLAGTMLGYYPVRVLPSKTAIAPVNPTFLPRSEDEREMCARTIYCTNIDKRVSQADVKLFFESVCGEVYRLRLLGDYNHATRIAFVEFVSAQSAIAALNCSGVVLGSLAIRISPSKTPVRPRAPRQLMH